VTGHPDPRFDNGCRTPNTGGLSVIASELDFVCDYLGGTPGDPRRAGGAVTPGC
jgi:hypothetical protein